jgi:exopolysaccharide biosynthesis polyprenyl glycosylphosphotransferase
VSLLGANTLAIVACRLIMRTLIRYLRRRGDDYRVWLVVGNNARAHQLVDSVQKNPHFGIRIAAVVDLPDKPPTDAQPMGSAPRPLEMRSKLLQDVEGVRDLVGGNVIDEVVITLPVRSFYDEIQQIVDICSEAGISVKLPPEAFARSGCRTEVVRVGEIPMVTHFTGPSNHTQLLVKRAVDAVGAVVSLTLFAPLMLLIAVAVKLTSSGPIFFLQTRAGLHGRHFRMIKFRSMVKDAAARRHELERFNERDAVAFKMSDDPRVTPVGKILRKFHLDELPQLWNVLVGDMSLVGPRPLPPGEACGSEWWQRRRLSMPPGITCSWQIRRDPRMPFREWVRLDLAYVDSWSVWLDVKLIALTVPAVVRGAGW